MDSVTQVKNANKSVCTSLHTIAFQKGICLFYNPSTIVKKEIRLDFLALVEQTI